MVPKISIRDLDTVAVAMGTWHHDENQRVGGMNHGTSKQPLTPGFLNFGVPCEDNDEKNLPGFQSSSS